MIALLLAEVISLTPETFGNYPLKFVKFFAPWCGHCKALAPDWVKLSETDIKIPIAEVDCEANGAICGENGVRGYPTVKLFNGDSVYDYPGARNVEAMREWAERMLKPALQYVDEKVAIEEASKEKHAFVVYTDNAEKDEKYFDSIKPKAKIFTVKSSTRKMVAYREGLTFELNKFSYASVDKFFNTHNQDLFPRSSDEVLSGKNQIVLIADSDSQSKIIKEVAEKVKELFTSKNPLTEKVTFSFLQSSWYKDKLEKDFKITEFPTILAIKNGKYDYYSAEYDSIEEFVEFANKFIKKDEL